MKPETALKRIAAIFEKTRTVTIQGYKATETTHAYYNLEGAIINIEHDKGRVDKVSMKTLKRVSGQIGHIGKVLKDAGYLKRK